MAMLAGDLRTLSYEAYLYCYPLVIMDVTRRQITNTPAGVKPGFGPPNEFHHMRSFPTAEFRSVVRPNFDTLYSSAWLDLTSGPVSVHAPDTDDRYYMLPMLDMWTDVFANPGKRTTGTGPIDFAVVGPDFAGEPPNGLPVIAAPTPQVWIIGRTQTNGPDDYPNVHRVQDGYRLTPVNPQPEHVVDPVLDFTTEPLTVVNDMSAVGFFGYAAELLAVNPPHPTDFSQLARIAQLGIEPGKPFDANVFSREERSDLEAGRAAALHDMASSRSMLGTAVNGWVALTDTVGVYGNAYFRRAAIALSGLGANPPEDAVYPLLTADSDGRPPVGENDYVIHFDADKLPPVSAFWSVTMYDSGGYQVANELNRFAIGDRDELVYNPDGSLDLYLQHDNPGPQREANWLPAPHGPLGITMRLYAPQRAILDGTWRPPAVRRV